LVLPMSERTGSLLGVPRPFFLPLLIETRPDFRTENRRTLSSGESNSVDEESIFAAALAKASPEERQAFLAGACSGDAELRGRVEALLEAHEHPDSFLEPRQNLFVSTIDAPIRERCGTLIGPYKLLEEIGEGGFGIVFMAEQLQPVRRKVALKVLKPGMDTRQVVARFEAERQALALMDHPNIAHILDGGATASGRPYFVMELVRGIPITEFCDREHMPVRERLELFVSVCQAVQHAHLKGVIHRDLKPSNVLVTLHDGTPVVKVIDFGIAKATGQQLTDKTLFTNFAQMVGTPLYMSPEQAGLSGLDVDTRCDIYSLGVLLYELLTGTTPFDKERLRTVGYDEMRRIIREEEPPKPSTRISTLGQVANTATQRKSDQRKLSQLFRGELDWIVMKCLEKDRNRRYETASGLARDVERYLHNEPVTACPPSAVYRLRKFAQRHKRPLVWSGLLVVLLLAGLTASAAWVWQEREEALVQRDLARKQRERAEANLAKARQAVNDSFTVLSESTLLRHPTLEPLRKQLLQAAVRYYEEFVQEHGDDPELQAELVAACFRITNMIYALGTEEDWLSPLEKGVAVMEDLMRKRPDVTALAGLQAGIFRPMATYWPTPKPAETLRAFEKARAIWEDLVRAHPTIPGFKSDLALFHGMIGLVQERLYQHAESARSFRQARDLLLQATASSPETPHYRVLLGMGLSFLQHELSVLRSSREAEEADRQALEVIQKLVAEFPDEPYYQELLAWALDLLAYGRAHRGQLQAEEEAWRLELATSDKLAQGFPIVSRYRNSALWSRQALAELLWSTGRRAEATELYRQVARWTDQASPGDAAGHHIRAWFLVTCPDPQFRDARRAVNLAKRATELAPKEKEYWVTLGLAHYRAGNWREAVTAPNKAMNGLVDIGTAADGWTLFLQAMAHWQLGDKEQARRCYDQAVTWTDRNETRNKELRRFRAEAAQLLGITKINNDR
jgi:serine/threonine protein kinase